MSEEPGRIGKRCQRDATREPDVKATTEDLRTRPRLIPNSKPQQTKMLLQPWHADTQLPLPYQRVSIPANHPTR